MSFCNITNNPISPLAVVKSTQIIDCKIDEGTLVGEKTSLKHSHIGSCSRIEPKTRISDTVVMGNVTIKQRFVQFLLSMKFTIII